MTVPKVEALFFFLQPPVCSHVSGSEEAVGAPGTKNNKKKTCTDIAKRRETQRTCGAANIHTSLSSILPRLENLILKEKG